ncbi:hypothetical protein BEN48_14870 [Hymenobacter glacialis]|uniref:Peptidase M56 domain-containing protein n=2 Tax=Hymenobacter glacialis TaxID=1908236 RepID=A0A1G1T360_9BACT|nr:hypothetical protein BEN48_14870 [Hymenobacter glacialis]
MTALENFVSPALMRALGWTLLHSLWQGALIAAVLAGALLLLRRQRAEVRYAASAGALGVVVALAGITFGLYFNAGVGQDMLLTSGAFETVKATAAHNSVPVAPAAATARAGADAIGQLKKQVMTANEAAAALPAAPAWLATSLRYMDTHMPLLVLLWLLGLLAMSLRMLGGLLYVQRLRRYRVRPLSQAWQDRVAVLAARSGLRRPVALLESALVRVPLVVGHVRPVILLPLGAIAGLSPVYLEAILAHELAHVLRRDYLVNLLQTVAEVLFFYHPAVWFVASCVRTERENCCDDAATALCDGDALRLARALTALAEWSQSAVVPTAPRLALAAIGSRGALLNRVRRLVQRRPAAPTVAEGLLAGALVLGGLGLLGSSVALAGPLTRSAAPAAGPAAFPWQEVGAATNTAAPESAVSVSRVVMGNEGRRTSMVQDEDTLIRTRVMRSKPGRVRKTRRVVMHGNGPDASSIGRTPNTVVITKDKKGRLTNLVVNGQRVETETGKRPGKGTKGKNNEQRVEIIRVVPGDGPEARAFVYRNDGANQFEREIERREEFRTRGFDNQFGSAVPGGSRGDAFGRNGTGTRNITIVRSDGAADGSGGSLRAQQEGLRAQREALRTAESALKEASAVKNLSAEQRKRLNQRLEEVRAQLRKTESAASSSQRRSGGADAGQPIMEMRLHQEEMRERQEEMREEMEERREEMRERLHESQSMRTRNGSVEDAMVAELLKDGLIKSRSTFQFRLSAKSLVVDGNEQPQKLRDKYLKLCEATAGRAMGPTNSMVLTRNSDSTTLDNGPRPPRAPLMCWRWQ